MKKRIIIISSILIIAILAAALMMLSVGATTPEPEAQLVITPEGGTATTTEGNLADLLNTVESSLSPTVATEYEITLLQDVTLTESVTLDGNGLESVYINLDGHTLTVGASDALITVGNIALVRLDGGFNQFSREGAIVDGGTSPLLLSGAGSVGKVKFINLNISTSKTEGSLLTVGGDVELVNTHVTIGQGSATLADVSGRLVFSYSSVTSNSSAAPITVAGGVLRLERSDITAPAAVSLSGDAYVILADAVIDVESAVLVSTDEDENATINIAGARIKAAALHSGTIDNEDVTFWYGTGSTYIEGFNPSEAATLGDKTVSVQSGGGYVLETSATTQAISVAFPDRGTPATTTGNFGTCLKTFQLMAPETPTLYTLAFLKDWTSSGSATPLSNGNPNVTVFIDLNGNTITRSTRNANLFTASGENNLYFDGADVDGKHGKIVMKTTNGSVMYNRESTDEAFLAFTGLDVAFTNSSGTSRSPIFQMVYGDVYMKDVNINYSGVDVPLDTDVSAYTLNAVRAQSNSRILVDGCNITNTSTNGMRIVGITPSGDYSFIVVRNSDIDCDFPVAAYDDSVCRICDSTVNATNLAYRAEGVVYVTDTDTTIQGDTVADGNVVFMIGTGKNVLRTEAVSVVGGKYEMDGYKFMPSSEKNVFVLSYSTIALPEVYTNGMVLQGRKPITIVGTSTNAGATVKVDIEGVATSEAVIADGGFTVEFEGLEYANDVTVSVYENDALTYQFTGVDIGEVWVMSGQSNSVYDITYAEDFNEYLLNADNFDNIRAYIVPQSQSYTPKEEISAKWNQIDRAYLETIASYSTQSKNKLGLSAVAYVMATRLATEMPDVTIAIVDANFNGSTVEAWAGYEECLEYAPKYAENYTIYRDFYLANGRHPDKGEIDIELNYCEKGKLYQRLATSCYNAMIAPMDGYTTAGVIWYQGEGNGGSVTEETDGAYYDRLKAVRASFRNIFRDTELPFFIIQIPPGFSSVSDFKNLQYKMANEDDNTHLVSHSTVGTVFCNEDFFISSMSDSMVHYSRKSPLGIATAAEILEHVYGMGMIASPNIVSVKRSGSELTIVFDREVTYQWGEEILGFELGNANGEFKTAIATVVDSKTVKLYAPGISVPKSVRYGYGRAEFEFKDGFVIEIDKTAYNFVATETSVAGVYNITITDNKTGDILYEFSSSDTYIIRARSKGNVISITGHALPYFRIDV